MPVVSRNESSRTTTDYGARAVSAHRYRPWVQVEAHVVQALQIKHFPNWLIQLHFNALFVEQPHTIPATVQHVNLACSTWYEHPWGMVFVLRISIALRPSRDAIEHTAVASQYAGNAVYDMLCQRNTSATQAPLPFFLSPFISLLISLSLPLFIFLSASPQVFVDMDKRHENDDIAASRAISRFVVCDRSRAIICGLCAL